MSEKEPWKHWQNRCLAAEAALAAEKAARWDLKRGYDAVYLLAQAHQATIATQAEELVAAEKVCEAAEAERDDYRRALMQIANNMMATPEDAGSYFRAVAVDALSRGSSI